MVLYCWQKEFFDNGAVDFQQQRPTNHSAEQERVAYLEKKIQTRDDVLAELMGEYIAKQKDAPASGGCSVKLDCYRSGRANHLRRARDSSSRWRRISTGRSTFLHQRQRYVLLPVQHPGRLQPLYCPLGSAREDDGMPTSRSSCTEQRRSTRERGHGSFPTMGRSSSRGTSKSSSGSLA